MPKAKDTLDRTIAFLQKRDGTDKTLKILRYSAKLVLALNLLSTHPEATKRLKSFESSVGTSRKALRIGKFLQDVNELRTTKSFFSSEGFLELLASGGECIYYFVEQFVWLVKAGAIDKAHGPRLQQLSATFELVGYVGSVTLKSMQVGELMRKEAALHASIQSWNEGAGRLTQESCKGVDEASVGIGTTAGTVGYSLSEQQTSLQVLQMKRVLKVLSLIQDLSDSLLALADVVDERQKPQVLRNPAILAACGLLSAMISAHKNWVAC